MESQIDFVGKVQSTGLYVGLGVDLPTTLDKFDSTILTSLDVVLVMSVAAGFGGQEFNENALKKIGKLDELRARDDTPFKIQDDGGVTLETVYNVHRVGADEVSIGRKIFQGDLANNLEKFQLAAHKLKNG
jgi:ribulose-phosphate 3-epimerase